MPQKNTILVTASFASGKDLFHWLKKYGQFADDTFVYYNDFAFTPYPLSTCDGLLVFNTPSEIINTECPPGRIVAFMMEPGIRKIHPWMFRQLEQYSLVYSPLPVSENTVLSHGFLGWYFKHDLNSLTQLQPPAKTKTISCIASGLKQLEGHRLRLAFINMLRKEFQNMDFFGKGSNYLEDKMDGLLPYRYSIAIENESMPFYFTEKINDCFLSWTVPIYHGCTNIGKFFPEKSFIKIDIKDTHRSLEKIRDLLANDDYNSRLPALAEARELVLHKYQPLAGAADIFGSIETSPSTKHSIKPVQSSFIERTGNILQNLFKSRS